MEVVWCEPDYGPFLLLIYLLLALIIWELDKIRKDIRKLAEEKEEGKTYTHTIWVKNTGTHL